MKIKSFNSFILESENTKLPELTTLLTNPEIKKVNITFHQDLDGVMTCIAMKEIVKQIRPDLKEGTTLTFDQTEYGDLEYAVRTLEKDPNTLQILVDFAKGSEWYEWHTDHHDSQRGVGTNTSTLFTHAKSNVIVLNDKGIADHIFSPRVADIFTRIDSAGFSNMDPSELRRFNPGANPSELADEASIDDSSLEKCVLYVNKTLLAHKRLPYFMQRLVSRSEPNLKSIMTVLDDLVHSYGIGEISKDQELRMSKEGPSYINKFRPPVNDTGTKIAEILVQRMQKVIVDPTTISNVLNIMNLQETSIAKGTQNSKIKTKFYDAKHLLEKNPLTMANLVEATNILKTCFSCFTKYQFEQLFTELQDTIEDLAKTNPTVSKREDFLKFYRTVLDFNAGEFLKGLEKKTGVSEKGVLIVDDRPPMFKRGSYDRYSAFSAKGPDGKPTKDTALYIVNVWKGLGMIQIAGNPFRTKTEAGVNLIDLKNELYASPEFLNLIGDKKVSVFDIKAKNEKQDNLFADSRGFNAGEFETLYGWDLIGGYDKNVEKALNTRLNLMSPGDKELLRSKKFGLLEVCNRLSGGHPGIVNITGFGYYTGGKNPEDPNFLKLKEADLPHVEMLNKIAKLAADMLKAKL
jgi:hypothetical protein